MSALEGQRRPCATCQAFAERFPDRTVKPGRPRSTGRWLCDEHGGTVPVPDPTRTLVGLQQQGWVRTLQDATRAALTLDVDPLVLREAFEAVLRSAELATP